MPLSKVSKTKYLLTKAITIISPFYYTIGNCDAVLQAGLDLKDGHWDSLPLIDIINSKLFAETKHGLLKKATTDMWTAKSDDSNDSSSPLSLILSKDHLLRSLMGVKEKGSFFNCNILPAILRNIPETELTEEKFPNLLSYFTNDQKRAQCNGQSACFIAMELKKYALLKILLQDEDIRADPDQIKSRGKGGNTIYHLAVLHNIRDHGIIHDLLRLNHANQKYQQNDSQDTPITLAIKKRELYKAKVLLKEGQGMVDISVFDDDENTATHLIFLHYPTKSQWLNIGQEVVELIFTLSKTGKIQNANKLFLDFLTSAFLY